MITSSRSEKPAARLGAIILEAGNDGLIVKEYKN
jgi:hypothetical protein